MECIGVVSNQTLGFFEQSYYGTVPPGRADVLKSVESCPQVLVQEDSLCFNGAGGIHNDR